MLPPSFASELADERWEVLHRLVLLVAQSPQKNSVGDFLGWLGRIPPGENLAIYLSETTTIGPAYIGIIIGVGPFAGTVGGFLGGILSDLFGRSVLQHDSQGDDGGSDAGG